MNITNDEPSIDGYRENNQFVSKWSRIRMASAFAKVLLEATVK
jgi:hypothetical protein